MRVNYLIKKKISQSMPLQHFHLPLLNKYGVNSKSEVKKILVGCFNRPPPNSAYPADRNLDERITESIAEASRLVMNKTFSSMMIAGDFNLPNVKWHDDGTVSVFGAENKPGEFFSIILLTMASPNSSLHRLSFKRMVNSKTRST